MSNFWRYLAISSLTLSCGISFDGDFSFIDTEPTGTRIHSASFVSFQSGQEVTGVAAIYQTSSSYVVRLEALDAPTTSPLQLVASSSGCADFTATLKGFKGYQNYSTGLNSCGTWSVVRIRTLAGVPPTNELAQANFD